MFTKKLRVAVAAFVLAALLPVSSASATMLGAQSLANGSDFVTSIGDWSGSLWQLFCQVLAKAGIRADQNGGSTPH